MSRMISIINSSTSAFKHSSFEVQIKNHIDYKMSSFGLITFGGRKDSRFNGRVSKDGKYIFMFSAQKFNRKTKRTVERKKVKTEVVRHGHWKVQVFRFPLALIKTANQGSRTFRVVLDFDAITN